MYVEIKSKSGYMVYHYWFSFSSGGGGGTGQDKFPMTQLEKTLWYNSNAVLVIQRQGRIVTDYKNKQIILTMSLAVLTIDCSLSCINPYHT